MKSAGIAVCALACLGAATMALAIPPDRIFERVAPGVWSVNAYTKDQKLLASASGVVVGPGRVVTSCQILAKARMVQLRRGNTIYDAKLEFPDVERDLCQLQVPGLTTPAPAVGSARTLRPGQRLYVVGFAHGSDPSIGEGLVSVVSEAGTEKERIRTTIPSARGLFGAGVFDEDARLVGIVTSSPKDTAATAFAVPADWLAELAERGQAALAKHAETMTRSVPGLPETGSSWTYGYVERLYGRRQIDITIRVARIDAASIEEALSSSLEGSRSVSRLINVRDPRFFEYAYSAGQSFVELSPYLIVSEGGRMPSEVGNPDNYPVGSPGSPGWVTSVYVVDWEDVTVPAGRFRALRLEVSGRRSGRVYSQAAIAGTFKLSVWYAPEVKRYVRMEQRVYSSNPLEEKLMAHDVVELLRYSPST